MKSTWERSLELAYELARERLQDLSPEEVARRAGGRWLGEEGVLELNFFGRGHRVALPQGEVVEEGGERPPMLREVLILHYLVQAKGTEPEGRWIDFRKLPGGEVYYPVFRGRIIYPLLRLFGRAPERLPEVAEALGGRSLSIGDGAAAFRAFPRVEVAFGIWRGSEEFGPEGFVLFDPTVTDYLSTEDAIWVCHEALARLKGL